MRMPRSTRRDFLRTVGLTAGVSALGLPLAARGQPPVPPAPPGGAGGGMAAPATVGVRQDIANLGPDDPDVKALAAGVQAMKNMPAGKFNNWTVQATIHNNFCPHGNWFFFPWHRCYLYYFEQICRQASGYAAFMLPYWNWTVDPQVPAEFWGDASNPLYDPTRQVGPNDSADSEYVGPTVIQQILAIPDFFNFAGMPAYQDCQAPPQDQRAGCGAGQLEGTPHNYIHGWIGGNMGTYMSPLDPIFWLHHANVDRLWTEWNKQFPNTNDPDWLGFVFRQNFWDASGNLVNCTPSQVLSTYELGYRYDTQPEVTATAIAPPKRTARYARGTVAAELANTRAAKVNAPLTLTLEPSAQLRPQINSLSLTARGQGLLAERKAGLRLELDGIRRPKSALGVRVFVNCPYVSAKTPIDDPHYAGSFTFFGHTQAGHAAAGHAGHTAAADEASFALDLSHTLARLGRARRYEGRGPIKVHLVPVPLGRRKASPALAAAAEAIVPKKLRLSYVEAPT
jgi:tyrosinase